MRNVLCVLGILSDSDLDWLLASGVRMSVAPDQVLVVKGGTSENIFVTLDGSFDVVSDAAQGSPVATVGAGEFIGELSFLDHLPSVANVVATSSGHVLAIPRAKVSAKLESDASFAARFYRALGTALASRLRSMTAGDSSQELDPTLLDNMTLAGARFEWMLSRLKGSE